MVPRVGVGAKYFRGRETGVLKSAGSISGLYTASIRVISGFNTLDTLEYCK